MTILILDGFIYFAVVFGAFLANMLIYAIASVRSDRSSTMH